MTPKTAPDPDLVRMLDEAAMEYSRKLSGENLMEAFAQGTQRKITLESFDLVARSRPDVHCFNEMLVQYPRAGAKKPAQVVPDNLVVVHDGPLEVAGHYSLTEQPARPFLVIEYVSKYNQRKDYEENYEKYELELSVPYYLLFYPDGEELSLYHLAGDEYEAVRPNNSGRLAIPEVEVEVALLDGWVRYWFRGDLLPLPAELADQRDAATARADAATARADAADARAASLEAEVARMREEMARLRGAG